MVGDVATQIKIINTVDGFLSLEKDWHELFAHSGNDSFYLSYHWFYINLILWDDPQRGIHIICIYDDNQLIAIIPTCIKERRLRFSSFRTTEIIGNIYTPLRGFIVRKGKELVAAEALASSLKSSSEWDMIRFDDMSENDLFLNLLVDTFRNEGIRSYMTHQYDNMVIDLSSIGDSNAYWNGLSASVRRNIKTRINKLNRDGSFDIILTKKPGQDLDNSIRNYFNIYEKSWKIQEADQEFHIRLFRYLAERGLLRLFTLYHCNKASSSTETSKSFSSYQSAIEDGCPNPKDSTPVATFFYLVYGKTAYFLKTAYREDYSQYSPGTILKWFLIKWFIDEDGISIIDFQKGNDDYKSMWAHFKEQRVLCKIANPRSLKAMLALWVQYEVIPFVLLRRTNLRHC
ncbi:GNAT family N-acetyltransferase [bacterium]|nr:MAG: GNAT family N-acetyltransferase [bacterium]